MENKKEPIRIAHIIGKWIGGGVESVVMNYYRNIDKSKIQFDFICDEDSTNIPYDEIKKLGGKVILIPPYQKVLKYHKELKKILKTGGYKIVHSHINTLSVFSLCAAWAAKVPVRIAHSHSTTSPNEKKKNFIKSLLRPLSKLFANNYMSCTEHAGRWMFGNGSFDNGKVFVLNNAIDLNQYKYNEKVRKEIRKELNINDDILVIGHLGRFVEQKNHSFLIDVFSKYHKINKNSMLLLIGQGPLMEEIQLKVKDLDLEESVRLLGQKDDAYKYYNAFDMFLFPSIYEGLGMVAIEAQCSGIPVIASEFVPAIAKLNNEFEFLSLTNMDDWVKMILKYEKIARNTSCDFKGSPFDIKSEAHILEDYYLDKKNK